MKQIRLRAWYRGKMYGFVEHHSFPDGSSGVNCIGEDIEHMFSPGDEVELIQFTGLKDKYGKEIWEGDIVKADWHWELTHKIVWPDDYYHVVEYALEEANLKVIGNIFENPELLNR